jgi:cyclic-di-GMP-binding protein
MKSRTRWIRPTASSVSALTSRTPARCSSWRNSKRGIDLSCLEVKDPVTNLASAQQDVILKQGLDQEVGKKLMRLIKDSKLKVQASLQGDKVRITGKSRDDLQSAIQLLRASKVEMPLQFNNFRD